jgi:acyl carrier protein
MIRTEFLRSLDEILELPPGTLTGTESLSDYALWDSTAMVSFMALVHEHSGTNLVPKALEACAGVADLLKLASVE